MKIKLDIYQRLHALEINLHNAGLSASAEQVKDAASAGCTSSEILNDSHRALTQILTQESLPDELRLNDILLKKDQISFVIQNKVYVLNEGNTILSMNKNGLFIKNPADKIELFFK